MVRPLRVALACTGLGHVHRGFEAFTRQLAQVLAGDSRVEACAYGGGSALEAGERRVWCLRRDSRMARWIGAVIGRGEYFVEQATFFLGLLPTLLWRTPDVIYFSDLNFGNACWHWRRLSGQRYRLLFYNGGPTTRPFTRCDLVQQVSPEHLVAALARGERGGHMVLLPHGLTIPERLPARSLAEVAAVRASLGIAPGRPMLLSVGLLGTNHKRMDALVDAVAALGDDRPHLVMLGARSDETPALESRVRGHSGYVTIATWPRDRMSAAYAAADAFALLSLQEGFGLAYVEALAAGLPCVAHDNATTRYIFGDHAFLGNTATPSVTVGLLRRALADAGNDAARAARHRWASDHFSWDVLAPRYVEMLLACGAGRRPVTEGV